MFNNRVEITLDSVLGRKVVKDPIGYKESEIEIGRSETTYGIFIKQINNLEFTGASKQYLEDLWGLYGPQARCRMIRRERHPKTDEWQLHSDGNLDFTTRKIKDNKLKISFVEGGLREVFVSQLREKFELDRRIDINGKAIPGLITQTLSLKGRDIYLASRLRSDETEIEIKSGHYASTLDLRESFWPLPLTVEANSDPENIKMLVSANNPYGGGKYHPATGSFFHNANRDRGKVHMKIKGSFRISAVQAEDVNDSENMEVRLYRYSGGDAYTVMPGYPKIIAAIGDPKLKTGQTFSIDYEHTFEGTDNIKEGESLAVYLYTVASYGDTSTGNTGYMDVEMDSYNAALTWNEDSFFRRTNSRALTAFEVGRRLSEIYTGKPCFESHLLQGKEDTLLKSETHDLLFAPGGWIRNLKKKVDIEDEFGNVTGSTLEEWPFEMSFEDYYKSLFALAPVGYGIAINGNRQNIVMEDLRFFFQRTVLIRLGKIQIKERSTAVEMCYQSLKFGYTKGGKYEKPLGLDEYNTQTSFRSPLTVTDNEYNALGESRADSYGAEDARRMQYSEYPDQDTPYDQDNFLFDCKFTGRSLRGRGGIYEPRLWADDFESAPSGVYSPETAYNLNLTPGRNRQRHEYWFTSGFYKLKIEAMQFLNSAGNSALKTKKAGEEPLKENAPTIPVKDLKNPINEPEWIDAEAPFDQLILEQITGTTLINGREINNYYGLAEFINEKNQPERAFIFTVKVKDKFTFKLLKAYGF